MEVRIAKRCATSMTRPFAVPASYEDSPRDSALVRGFKTYLAYGARSKLRAYRCLVLATAQIAAGAGRLLGSKKRYLNGSLQQFIPPLANALERPMHQYRWLNAYAVMG